MWNSVHGLLQFCPFSLPSSSFASTQSCLLLVHHCIGVLFLCCCLLHAFGRPTSSAALELVGSVMSTESSLGSLLPDVENRGRQTVVARTAKLFPKTTPRMATCFLTCGHCGLEIQQPQHTWWSFSDYDECALLTHFIRPASQRHPETAHVRAPAHMCVCVTFMIQVGKKCQPFVSLSTG